MEIRDIQFEEKVFEMNDGVVLTTKTTTEKNAAPIMKFGLRIETAKVWKMI